MNKVSKEYVDAQIASVEDKFEERMKTIMEQIKPQKSQLQGSDGNVPIPVGFTQKDGEPVILMNHEIFDKFGREIVCSILKAKAEHEEKRKAEGGQTREEWYASIYNNNCANWKRFAKCFTEVIDKRDDIRADVKKNTSKVSVMTTTVDYLSKTIEDAVKKSKPTGIFIYGKHIAGYYFFIFIAFLFIFLGIFGYGYFAMQDKAKRANVCLHYIRTKHSDIPSVRHSFEMLDSVFARPKSSKKD